MCWPVSLRQVVIRPYAGNQRAKAFGGGVPWRPTPAILRPTAKTLPPEVAPPTCRGRARHQGDIRRRNGSRYPALTECFDAVSSFQDVSSLVYSTGANLGTRGPGLLGPQSADRAIITRAENKERKKKVRSTETTGMRGIG